MFNPLKIIATPKKKKKKKKNIFGDLEQVHLQQHKNPSPKHTKQNTSTMCNENLHKHKKN
jgi:hypothetical protein